MRLSATVFWSIYGKLASLQSHPEELSGAEGGGLTLRTWRVRTKHRTVERKRCDDQWGSPTDMPSSATSLVRVRKRDGTERERSSCYNGDWKCVGRKVSCSGLEVILGLPLLNPHTTPWSDGAFRCATLRPPQGPAKIVRQYCHPTNYSPVPRDGISLSATL